MDQRRELVEQKRVNAQCRQVSFNFYWIGERERGLECNGQGKVSGLLPGLLFWLGLLPNLYFSLPPCLYLDGSLEFCLIFRGSYIFRVF